MARMAEELDLPDFDNDSGEDQVGDTRVCDADGSGSGSEGEDGGGDALPGRKRRKEEVKGVVRGVSSTGRATAKSAAKGKAKAGAKGDLENRGGQTANNGAKSKVQEGFKQCKGCKKVLPESQFPTGSANCYEDKQAITNIAAAAKAQGELVWWDEQKADLAKLQKTLAQCPQYYYLLPARNHKSKESDLE